MRLDFVDGLLTSVVRRFFDSFLFFPFMVPTADFCFLKR